MKAQRIFRANRKTADERLREQKLRDRLQRERPSQDDLIRTGECDPDSIMTMGMYFDVQKALRALKQKNRIEVLSRPQITTLNNLYHEEGTLSVRLMSRGMAWLDTGTPDSLMEAGAFVQTIEKRQGQKIACLEEIALRLGLIDEEGLRKLTENAKSEYYKYLRDL